jgi:hypothetical protein
MRESCTSGSVRGARGNSRPYRNRREFITLLGGAAVAWPLAALAQPSMRRIGVLMSTAEDDPESQLRLIAFVQGLQKAGWTAGHNLQIETRWASGDIARIRKYTAELLALSPDIILAGGRAASIVPEVRRAGRDTPIVFVQGVDPVGTADWSPRNSRSPCDEQSGSDPQSPAKRAASRWQLSRRRFRNRLRGEPLPQAVASGSRQRPRPSSVGKTQRERDWPSSKGRRRGRAVEPRPSEAVHASPPAPVPRW